jgi:hypothetical protein
VKFEAVIFNWVGHEQRAAALERQLGALCRVRVVNSESAAEARHPHWEHVGEDAYFAAQWQRAVQGFDADVMFHVQADAQSPDFDRILCRCREAMKGYGAGVYAPNVDYTPWVYQRSRLQRVAPDLYEVPQTDCTGWAIARDVLVQTPPVDPVSNKYGWAIDFLVIATARALGRRVVRDYRYTLAHRWKGSGYDTLAADVQARAMLAAMPPELAASIAQLKREAEARLGHQPWRRRLDEGLRRRARAVRAALR